MSDERLETTSQPAGTDSNSVDRRKFLAASCGAGALMVAGCSSQSGSDDGSTDDSPGTEEDPDGSSGEANFRLLISDRPADIGDFDRLDVSFDRARIFEDQTDSGEDENSEEGEDSSDMDGNDGEESPDSADDGNETSSTEGDADTSEEESETDSDEPTDDQSDDGSGGEGFYTLELDGETVDLTTVVDDKAVSVFDGQLSEGRYTKIELYVADIEGVVDGEMAEVKVPSGKLQITHAFEITAEEPVDFVFDINVVKRGQALRYNLTPVISESGVAGKDVDVEEVRGKEGSEEDEDGDGASDEGAEDGSGNGGETGGDGNATEGNQGSGGY